MEKTIKCPDCRQTIKVSELKGHVLSCKQYKAKLFENTIKLSEYLTNEYLEFLLVEMDMAKETIRKSLQKSQQNMRSPVKKAEIQDFEELFSSAKVNHSQKPSIPMKPNTEQFQSIDVFNEKLDHQNLYDPTIRVNHAEEFIIQHKKQENEKQMIEDKIFEKKFEKKNASFQSLAKKKSEDKVSCQNCAGIINAGEVSKFVYIDPCFHLLCLNCMKSYIEDQYIACNGTLKCLVKGCKQKLRNYQVKEILGEAKIEQLENQIMDKMIGNINLVKCKKCGNKIQFIQGNIRDAPKKDAQGKKLSKQALQHFVQNRFICPESKCRQEQCKNCSETPYHIGKTCEQFKQLKLAKKCRYCKTVLKKGYISNKGIKAFDDICPAKQCSKIAKKACSKILKCNHPCMGYINEKECLPCLDTECSKEVLKHDQSEDSYCSICYIEDLKASPCIMSKCGHIYHLKCLEKRLDIRWLTPRINFNFCKCPLCNEWIEIPNDSLLAEKVHQFRKLEEKLKDKALRRLKHEHLEGDEKLTDPKSPFYQKPIEYAMAIYAYFQCFKCKQPYFGGRKSCAERMENADRGNSEDFDATKLVCPGCCPISSKNCQIHGKQFISFKCKFCCNIAQWFCWGSTHFCDKCHKRQTEGEYLSKLPKDKLPKCQGPEKCPTGGYHPPNGEQYNLGCILCLDYKKQKADF